jgi:2-polyprenyl-3-methyl-5-hydroxy-6-metoxy-1,4-benzoquinol methylase
VAVGHRVEPAHWQAEADRLLEGMAGRFARVETRRRLRGFLFGLLADLPRKNCWSIAEHAGDPDPHGMQSVRAAGAGPASSAGLGRLALTPFYDLMHQLARLGGLHAEMIRLADPQPGQRVLDIGYATGNLLLALGRNHPSVELIGLDPDLAASARARRKATRARIAVRWAAASPRSCPTQTNRSTGVLSSLMLHHLDPPAKDAMLAAVRRVLRPHGTLVLADLDGDRTAHIRLRRRDHLREEPALAGQRQLTRCRRGPSPRRAAPRWAPAQALGRHE